MTKKATICIMCHLSSECSKCCRICNNLCNEAQVCMQGAKEQYERWRSWIDVVETNNRYKQLFNDLQKNIPTRESVKR